MRIGTRGSALALVQAESVARRLGDDAEIVTITTSGDRGASGGDKSRWVSELERALLEDRIDVAVHSAKDVPTELADGLELVAIPERADPRDVICGARSLAELAPGARVGTSSLRRAAQISAARADLEVVTLRGNVDTRLRKLAEGQCRRDRARAGRAAAPRPRVRRGRRARRARAGGRPGRAGARGAAGALDAEALAAVSDPDTTACVTAERELVRALGASCNTPVGAHAQTVDGVAASDQRLGRDARRLGVDRRRARG